MDIAREILEKHLSKDLDIKSYLRTSPLTYQVVLDAIEEAINYTHSCTTLKDKEIPTFEQYRNLIYKNKMHGFINKETSRYMDYEDMETRYNWLLKNL